MPLFDGITPTAGIALDGFPIYGPIDEDGKQLTSRELDECHGRFTALGEYRSVALSVWQLLPGLILSVKVVVGA